MRSLLALGALSAGLALPASGCFDDSTSGDGSTGGSESGEECELGREGCMCFDNFTCLGTLECVGGICMQPAGEDGGPTSGDSSGDGATTTGDATTVGDGSSSDGTTGSGSDTAGSTSSGSTGDGGTTGTDDGTTSGTTSTTDGGTTSTSTGTTGGDTTSGSTTSADTTTSSGSTTSTSTTSTTGATTGGGNCDPGVADPSAQAQDVSDMTDLDVTTFPGFDVGFRCKTLTFCEVSENCIYFSQQIGHKQSSEAAYYDGSTLNPPGAIKMRLGGGAAAQCTDALVNIGPGEYVTMSYDGKTLPIYLPCWSGTDNTLTLYVAGDGSTYYDEALTQIAQRAP